MDGYKRVPASWGNDVPIDEGDDRACGLCPRHQKGAENPCHATSQCDAGHGMVWVPDHIHALWLMNASESSKRHLANWMAHRGLEEN